MWHSKKFAFVIHYQGRANHFGGGLGPLPAWVRGQDRVRTWVWAKLLINGIRILKRQGLTHSLAKCCERGNEEREERLPCSRLPRAPSGKSRSAS